MSHAYMKCSSEFPMLVFVFKGHFSLIVTAKQKKFEQHFSLNLGNFNRRKTIMFVVIIFICVLVLN